MSDDDLIRRGDAMAAYEAAADSYNNGSDGRWFRHHLADAIAALPAVTVRVQERVQHKKRGSTYRVLGRGKVQTDTPLSDYAEVVVYQGEADGLVWVRPVSEFDDGRFAALDLTPARQCDHPYCADTCGPEQVYGIDPQPAPDAQAVREFALTYRDGWRFAYRQFQHTGSVPDPDYAPPNSEEAALIAAPAKGGA